MTEEMQKIYCCPNSNSPADIAALLNGGGGMNNWMNNPWIYFVFLAMFGGGNGLFGNRNTEAENYNSRAIATLQDTVATNHNNDLALQAINGNRAALGQLAQTFNTDITAIQSAICSVKSAVEQVSGQVGYSSESVKNAIAMGDASIVSKMQECCCANKLLVQQMGYEGQLRDQANTAAITSRIDQLANGIQQGFAQVGYATQAQTCEIINASNSNTQRILDTMNNHWSSDLQQRLCDAKLELSQQKQNLYLVEQLKTT